MFYMGNFMQSGPCKIQCMCFYMYFQPQKHPCILKLFAFYMENAHIFIHVFSVLYRNTWLPPPAQTKKAAAKAAALSGTIKLQLRTCGNECLAGFIAFVLDEVLDEPFCEVFCLFIPF